MTNTKIIILEYICPALGTIMANIMFAAPFQDLQTAVRQGQLGTLNPTPWAFMLGNCFGWVTYGVLIHNFWIYFANAPGFLLSIWLNLGATKLLYQQHYSLQMRHSVANYLSTRKLNIDNMNDMNDDDDNDEEQQQQQQQELLVKTTTTATKNGGDTAATAMTSTLKTSNSAVSLLSSSTPSTFITANPTTTEAAAATTSTAEVPKRRLAEKTLTKASPPPTAAAAVTTPTTTPNATSSTVHDSWFQIIWDVTSQTTPAPIQHETLVLVIASIWMAVATFLAMSKHVPFHTKELVIGIVVNFNLVFFYGAPLSTIWTVLSEQSSASIHIPTMMTNTLNGSFWTAYGFAVNDYYVFVPNGLGTLLGMIQIILCFVFPRNNNKNNNNNTTETITSNNTKKRTSRTETTAKTTILMTDDSPIIVVANSNDNNHVNTTVITTTNTTEPSSVVIVPDISSSTSSSSSFSNAAAAATEEENNTNNNNNIIIIPTTRTTDLETQLQV